MTQFHEDSHDDHNPQVSDSSKQESGQSPEGLEILRSKIDQLEKELANTRDQYARNQADMMNLMKRKDTEREQAVKHANFDFLREFLFVLDSLESGIQSFDHQNEAHKDMLSGLVLMQNQINQLLERFDVKVLSPEIGSPFDPITSEAMSIQVNDQLPAQSILLVVQKGYMSKGRLLRPARVIVAKNSQTPS